MYYLLEGVEALEQREEICARTGRSRAKDERGSAEAIAVSLIVSIKAPAIQNPS
jgi:hypothetical protein